MDDLAKLVKRMRADVERLDQSRAALHDAILRNLAEGMTQTEVSRQTGYSREYLRQMKNR